MYHEPNTKKVSLAFSCTVFTVLMYALTTSFMIFVQMKVRMSLDEKQECPYPETLKVEAIAAFNSSHDIQKVWR